MMPPPQPLRLALQLKRCLTPHSRYTKLQSTLRKQFYATKYTAPQGGPSYKPPSHQQDPSNSPDPLPVYFPKDGDPITIPNPSPQMNRPVHVTNQDSKSREETADRYALGAITIFVALLTWWMTSSGIKKVIGLKQPTAAENAILLAKDLKNIEELEVVKAIRKSSPGEWKEWWAYSSFKDDEKPQRLTTGPLGGAPGLQCQRIFYNEATGQVINVVRFGFRMSGWPFIAHGGAIATVLDETLGRCAILALPKKTGVTAYLNIQYRKTTQLLDYMVIVADIDKVRSTETKAYVTATLWNPKQQACVMADGLFVVPRGVETVELAEGF